MTPQTKTDSDSVSDSSDRYETTKGGIICSPGKFEGEPIYVPYLWNCVLLGDGELVDDPGRPGGWMEALTLTESDKAKFPELREFDVALLWADDSGFVYCDLQKEKADDV